MDVVIPIPPKPITSNASEPVALNSGDPETNISLKWEPIDTNAVPGADSLTFKPVLSSNCNFVNCLLYVLPPKSEPEIWNGTLINPSALPLNADALTEPDDSILKLVNIPPFGTTKLEDSILTLEPLKGAILLTLNKPSIKTEPVKLCVSSAVSPNLVEPDSYKTEDVTIEVCISFAVIIPDTFNEPVIVVSVLTTNPLFGDIDAVALPLAIWNKLKPVIPLDGILYNWLPSPLNDPVNEPVLYDDVNVLKSLLILPLAVSSESNLPFCVLLIEATLELKLSIELDNEELKAVIVLVNPLVVVAMLELNEPIEDVNEDSIAYDAGFVGGDLILTINGIRVVSWQDMSNFVKENEYGELMTFTVLRDGNEETITVEPHDIEILEYSGVMPVENYIGISPEYNLNFFKSFTYSFTNTKNAAMMIFNTIGLLFSNENVGVGDLAGPVGIYSITSTALSGGIFTLLGWVGLLSVNLGVINLLPIPALDGGRLVFLGYEAITTRKPNKRIENTLHYAMYLMLLGLFVYITFNDILRLFNVPIAVWLVNRG